MEQLLVAVPFELTVPRKKYTKRHVPINQLYGLGFCFLPQIHWVYHSLPIQISLLQAITNNKTLGNLIICSNCIYYYDCISRASFPPIN
jgi:hypothetical protein